MIKSVLFDLDGVLCEMPEQHYLALNKALLEVCGFEISREEHESKFNGLPTLTKLSILTKENRVNANDHIRISELKQEFTFELIDSTVFQSKDKIEIFYNLKTLNILIGVVTNSIRKTTLKMLKNLGILDKTDIVISNQDVLKPKPSPEPYIRAMISLFTFPDETLIIEDSDKGYAAALASTANVWRVKNSTEVIWNNLKEQIGKINA